MAPQPRNHARAKAYASGNGLTIAWAATDCAEPYRSRKPRCPIAANGLKANLATGPAR